MKCPLLLIGCYISGKLVEAKHENCLYKKCAWWDSTAEKCAILQMAFELDDIHCWLEKLVNKMPHAGQFLK